MATTLGKGDIASRVASKLKGTQAEGSRALDTVLEEVIDALKVGHTVTLTGFGTFEVRDIKARQVRSIRGAKAGQLVSIPAHKRPAFRPGTELTRAVEQKVEPKVERKATRKAAPKK
jgi:DNA-binding protein HU-beta